MLRNSRLVRHWVTSIRGIIDAVKLKQEICDTRRERKGKKAPKCYELFKLISTVVRSTELKSVK